MAASSRPVLRLVLFGLVAATGYVLFVRPDLLNRIGGPAESLDPCSSPLAWHIRSVDPRFGFTRPQLADAVEEAADVWEEAGGRRFFIHDTAGAMAIDLVYDERQQAAERRQEREATLAELAAEVEEIQSLLDRTEARVRDARDHHQQEQTRATADAYRRAVERHNGVVNRLNLAVARYNQALEEARAEDPADVTAGDLHARGRTLGGRVVSVDRTLTVAVAGDYDELVTVLAHELGHALGLGHAADPDALMAERYRQGDVALPVRLSAADRRALVEACELTADRGRGTGGTEDRAQ